MATWTTTLARILLVVTMASPLVQVHTDHLSGSLTTQGLLSVVLAADEQSHNEAVPHEDTTEHAATECDLHPTQVQAAQICQRGSAESQQREVIVYSYFLNAIQPASTVRNQEPINGCKEPEPHIPDRVPTVLVLRV